MAQGEEDPSLAALYFNFRAATLLSLHPALTASSPQPPGIGPKSQTLGRADFHLDATSK